MHAAAGVQLSRINAKGLDQLRNDYPLAYESLKSVLDAVNQIGTVTGVGTSSPATTPANHGMLSVTGANGIFDVAIHDPTPQRGESYFVEHSMNGQFTDAVVHHLGPARNMRVSLGNLKTYWRMYKQLPGSNVSDHVYFGGNKPIPVVGGGQLGPTPQASQGSGTSKIPGHGFGPIGQG